MASAEDKLFARLPDPTIGFDSPLTLQTTLENPEYVAITIPVIALSAESDHSETSRLKALGLMRNLFMLQTGEWLFDSESASRWNPDTLVMYSPTIKTRGKYSAGLLALNAEMESGNIRPDEHQAAMRAAAEEALEESQWSSYLLPRQTDEDSV